MNTLISIVIANYNYGRFLADAIESVLDQDMGDDVELIICDGGSTDNSIEVIKKYEDKIAWWVSEKDGGQSAAFNKGFAHARGRFLTWLNADDILTKGALRAIAKEIQDNPLCEWFVGSSVWADENLKISRCFCAHRFSVLRARWGFLSAAGPSSFFTKRALQAAGGIDESLHYVMDTDLWYKFYFKCGLRYRRTRHNVWAYRQHEASKMSGADEYVTERAIKNRDNARRESLILDERYGHRGGMCYRLAQALSFSILDHLVARVRFFRWRRRDARTI